MKAQDLRVGNFISDSGLKSTVLSIDELGCTTVNNGDYSSEVYKPFNEYKPIRLTKEWLLKFGFIDTTGGWGGSSGIDYHYANGNFKIQTYDSDNNWHLKNNYDAKFNYVHQLQNIYYSLTGKELTEKTQ